ncbi:amino acid ABC transporter ATP-binding protein [Aerococcus urinaeequi]|uniref:amino acid ABC transporter ATP-binding protein n=1 Tax=Aerococcus urinaeequi TaxID=51665 RepID=UPI000744CD29|nr:amino acid ABC transporter ATP-binding protein [Aerococcus urinaeequi]ALZ87843.1 amino acid ABC transporter ATP-binding protein [Aerococcus urinaeequi]
MITVEKLVKKFGDNTVLKGIDFQVNEGEVVAIIGPSGSGKSTFLRSLNLLESPESGTIEINGVKVIAPDIKKQDAFALRQQTAMVFQHYNLFRNKTALENVTLSLISNNVMKKDKAAEFGEKLLKQVGLSKQKDQYPVTLSGGQQQRVSIARALAVQPKAILLDEPTSALDPELVNEVLETIEHLAKGHTTLVIVTHEMNFARKVADRVVFMNDGVVVESGRPEEIFTNPKEERTKQFLKEYIGVNEYVI